MLKGEKVELRPLRMDDWHKTIEWRNDITIKKLAMMHPFPITEINEIEWYEELLKSKSDKTIYFAIADKQESLLGFIFLNNINYTNKNCYLGIVIGKKDAQGKGYGFEAMTLIIDYAFNILNLNKITIEVVEYNQNAIHLYKKLGFIEEGNLKQQLFVNGSYKNVYLMSLFRKKMD